MEAKKSLGQNFFVNDNLADRIVEQTLENNPKTVIEIGPGRGFFTQRFLAKGVRTIAIEKDNDLATQLQYELPDLEIINNDFLALNIENLDINPHETVFYGSLPYNISKPIIRKILNSFQFKTSAYFIIQKEVAEKYIAKTPNSNILSLQTALYAKTKKLFDISKGSFRPVPKVTSSFIKFTYSPTELNIEDKKAFEGFLISCFTSPRKTLRNNIKQRLQNKNIQSELLSQRPQQLTLEQYFELFTLLK